MGDKRTPHENAVPLSAGSSGSPHRSALQWLAFAASLVVTAFFLYLIFAQVDFFEIGHILRNANPAYLALGFLTLVVAYAARSTRLYVIVAPHSARATVWKCAKAVLVGVALNNVYPFRLGDVYRVVAFRSELGVEGAKMLGALAIERIVDLSMILLCLALALVLLPADVLDPQIRTWSLVLMIAAVVAFLLMLFATHPLRRLLALLPWRSGPVGAVLRFGDSLLEGVETAVASRSLVLILVIATLGWAVEIPVLSFVVGRAVGLESGYASGLLGLVLSNLSTLVPSSPGYVGTFDYFGILGITASGGDVNRAAAFAILAHVVIWVFTTVCGLAFLISDWYRRLRAPTATAS